MAFAQRGVTSARNFQSIPPTEGFQCSETEHGTRFDACSGDLFSMLMKKQLR